MDVKKALRVTYNPYFQTFLFEHAPKGNDFSPIANESDLRKYQDKKCVLQNCADEVLQVIYTVYALDSEGTNIHFVGTQSDYQFFADIARAKQPGKNKELHFSLEQQLIAGDQAIEVIDAAYDKIKGILEDYKADDSIRNEVEKYHEAAQSEFNLIVVGTYSSGKSTFINGLIGRELLPEGVEPVTAMVTKVSDARGYTIAIKVKQGETEDTISLAFTKDNYNFSGPTDKHDKLAAKLKKALSNKAMDEVSNMYSVLSELDRLADQIYKENKKSTDESKRVLGGWTLSSIREVTLPFDLSVDLTEGQSLIIWDTPGSNSAIDEQHKDTLKDRLDNQTIALPVVVLKYDDIFSKDQADLDKLLSEAANKSGAVQLDLTHAINIVSRADIHTPNELQSETIKERLVEKSIKKMLFTAPIIALGAKNKGKLNRENYKAKFNKSIGAFKSDNPELYLKLYEYAILPRVEDMSKIREAGNSVPAADKYTKMLHDSGMYAIEHTIRQYANQFLQYANAPVRRKHLLEAVKLAEDEKTESNQALETAKQEYIAAKNTKREELSNKIEIYSVESDVECITNETVETYKTMQQQRVAEMEKSVKAIWEEIKPRGIRAISHEKVQEVIPQLHKAANEYAQAITNELVPLVEKFLIQKFDELRGKVQGDFGDIINGDEGLTDEAKRKLIEIINNTTFELLPYQISEFVKNVGDAHWWIFSRMGIKKYIGALKVEYYAYFLGQIAAICNHYIEEFEKYMQRACRVAFQDVDLSLRQYDDKIAKFVEEIKQLNTMLSQLNTVTRKLENLLEAPISEEVQI